ncbi:hypothetical protein PLICRDRAFT_142731 [Plicaturopsis crispa FD-325 SS-3]|nr:hypothetical protein PLICRDRAFT_142731 [Plicaturopsis crispa FD-325 SS-3]
MAVLSLPLSFTNSFWSQDYRRGLEVLFEKLNQGVAENAEIVAFIRARAVAEGNLASALTNPALTGPQGTGFGADDGASLLMAFRGLQSESATQGTAHRTIANELNTLVADPFEDWAQGYRERLRQSRATVIDHWLKSYEHSHGEVSKLKHQYLNKTRRADEAEDDAKFAPNNDLGDTYTTSPRIRPRDARAPPQRTPSVSERIAARLKEIQRKSAGVAAPDEPPKTLFDADPEDKATPKVDKGKGKAVEGEVASPTVMASPPPMSPPLPPSKISIEPPASPMPPPPPSPILLAGLSLPPAAISSLLVRAASELPLRPIRIPLLGEYQDCFTGEEFVTWLNEHVDGFGGSFDRAEDAARDLTERDGLLRRIGEFGNLFQSSDDAYYQFRPKAFDLEGKNPEVTSPTKALAPVTDNLIKRSGTFVSLVSKAISNANAPSQPAYIRARLEAEAADKAYRIAVRKLDRQRLGLEERIQEALKALQRWETERLRAVKTVLLQYQGTLANLPKGLEASNERSQTILAAYHPDNDLNALIERYRTGPFRPHAEVYESVAHDESDVLFGVDLRKWAEGGWTTTVTGEEAKDTIPLVLSALLEGLKAAYDRLPEDSEKRKAWIYEVPLPAVHHLREALNAIPPEQPIPGDILEKYDAPVIAAVLKLWLLELDPPLVLWEGWDDFRKLYPTVGSAPKDGEVSEQQHIQDLSSTLQRLPRVHLYVLDAVVKHIKDLIDSTTVEEPNEVYITKLALSMGRSIIRPKFESEITVQDRHPTLLFIDLIKNYSAILPPTITRKKRESERKIPLRKRTAPIDMRFSRSKMNNGIDAKEALAAQQQNRKPEPAPPVPALPPQASVIHDEPEELPAPPPAAKPATPPAPKPAAPVPKASPPKPAAADPNAPPPRPSFKEPPPEDDDLPPRPNFKEPPPEDDDTPPRPNFADPPEEPASPPAAAVSVTPPTPLAKRRDSYRSGSPSPSLHQRTGSASPSDDKPLSNARSSLTRNGSNQAASQPRGPRISRGPRAPGGSSVSSIVSTLNRAASPPASPSYKRLSGERAGAAGSRPSSIVGRSGAFSRRTMASDAEDNVVDK